jgi:lipoprotein-anchoring transpeptidase ErfK/SrfK
MRPNQNQPSGAPRVGPRLHARGRVVLRGITAVLLIGALGFSAACTGSGSKSSDWHGGGEGGGAAKGSQSAATITTPADNATDVPAATEISFKRDNAKDATVELNDPDGKSVEGKLRDDGSSWVPDEELAYAAKYTATVTATDSSGKTTTATSTFTTMAKPANQVRVTSFLGDNAVVGVAMPLIVRFDRDVPQDYRDDVQRRLFVQSTPAQEGIWHWVSPTEVRYRPKAYWQAGTKLSYRLATGGLKMGDGYYGRSDVTVVATVGSALIVTVNNGSHQLTVAKDGKALRTFPISLGKAKTPTSSGTMVIIEKFRKTVFDTFAELGPTEGYRADIEYAQRLTWGGEYLHAAPWSVGQQGSTNVSHGCVNMSMANAKWLFGLTQVGDPVIIKGTGAKLQDGNGWTDWNDSWADYVQGSAIPYQAPSAASASPTAS